MGTLANLLTLLVVVTVLFFTPIEWMVLAILYVLLANENSHSLLLLGAPVVFSVWAIYNAWTKGWEDSPWQRKETMKIRSMLATALLGLTLGACAPTPLWTKANLTEAEWRADQYTCERDTRMIASSFGGGIVGALEANRFLARCLEAKGYRSIYQNL
jgi:hypothetical protein